MSKLVKLRNADITRTLRYTDRIRRALSDACQERGLVLVGAYRSSRFKIDIMVCTNRGKYLSIRGTAASQGQAWTNDDLDRYLVVDMVRKLDAAVAIPSLAR